MQGVANPRMRKSNSRRNALQVLKKNDSVGVILLGKSKVGKSALVERWVKSTFSNAYKPTVEDFHVKTYKNSSQSVNVGLIDMSGSWDFPAMMDLYLNKVECVMFVYDVSDDSSIIEMKRFYKRFVKVRGENHEVKLSVIGTKVDVKQQLSDDTKNEAIEEFLSELGTNVKHVMTSAKLDLNIDEAFGSVLNDLIADMPPSEDVIKRLDKLMRHGEKKKLYAHCTIL